MKSLSPSARRILISLNPRAGGRSGRPAVDRLCELLTAKRFSTEVITDINELTDRVDQLALQGELRCVVAAGGDGTAALIANRTPPGTPLAILPLGTENLLAKHLGVGYSPDDIARAIDQGRLERVDAGRAGDRLFLIMAGCGFDAEVVRRFHQGRTGNIQRWWYAKPILDSIRTYHYPELLVKWEVVGDDASGAARAPTIQSVSARWAFVVNLPRYAGGLRIAPAAIGDDGLLDVCAFKAGSLWHGLRYLSGVWLGWHEAWEDCMTCRVKRVRIESEDVVPYQLDGDPGGVLPLDIEVLEDRITLVTPASGHR